MRSENWKFRVTCHSVLDTGYRFFDMDTTKLSMLLTKAESSGITFSKIPKEIQPWHKETYIIDHVNVEKEIEDELLEVIKEIPEFTIFDGKLFNCGSQAQRVELEQIVKWLLYSTHRYGVDKTLDNLNKYFEIDGNPLYEVQLVSGIEVEQEVELIDNTWLVPFDKIPDCWQKNYYSPDSYKFPDNKYCSKAAILRKTKSSPKSYHQDEGHKMLLETDIQLSDFCEILTLVGPSAPYPTTYWTILEEIVPLKLVTGLSDRMSSLSYLVYKYEPEDYALAKNIVKSYLSLSGDLKNSLLLSIKRLNMAQRRNSMENKAIDLGIALEILLLKDRGKHELIAFPFRLRGAWFLGEDIKRRRVIYDLLQAIYDCRSSAVHSGKLKKVKYKIDGKDVQLTKLFEEGFNLCAELITKIIKERKYPDWNKLTLGIK